MTSFCFAEVEAVLAAQARRPHVCSDAKFLADVDVILSDIDGTFYLANHANMQTQLAQNLAALQRAEEAGIPVAFVTGRPFPHSYDHFGATAEEGLEWLVGRPGAYADGIHILGENGEVVEQDCVPGKVLAAAIEAVKGGESVGVIGHCGTEVYSAGDPQFAEHDRTVFGGPAPITISWEGFAKMEFQCVNFCDKLFYWAREDRHYAGLTPANLDKLRRALSDCDAQLDSENCGLETTATNCLTAYGRYVRLIAPGHDKGTGALALLKCLDKKKPLCLGDFLNDIPMFKALPESAVAMGNSAPAVLKAAAMVAGRVDAEPVSGWAQVVDAVIAAKAEAQSYSFRAQVVEGVIAGLPKSSSGN